MRQILLVVTGILISFFASAQYNVKFEIGLIPGNEHNSGIFLAGSFNNWDPGNKNYRFSQLNGKLILELSLHKGFYEFKLTRGAWSKVECKADGLDMPNRILRLETDTAILIQIEGWKDQFIPTVRKSTAGKNVQVMDTAFFIPQLNRTRRIWVYLPESYTNSKKRYPVIYMNDGQNVFDDSTSYAGEWGVDEYLDTLGVTSKECIVVAIDHGGDKRMNEYCPYDFSLTGIGSGNLSGKGEGKEYVDFLAKTLKPYIDKTYRTYTNKKNTFIAGSSMGGLISMYAVLRYPRVFGGAGVFSPAFRAGPAIFDDIKAYGNKTRASIFFYAGTAEGETMVPGTEKAFELMKQFPLSRITKVIRENGRHNETRWRAEFPGFYNWLVK